MGNTQSQAPEGTVPHIAHRQRQSPPDLPPGSPPQAPQPPPSAPHHPSLPPSPYSHSVAVPPLRGAAGDADASLQSMYIRGGSGMSLASRHSSTSYTPSDDSSASAMSDSMHRIVSDSESDGDPLVPPRMPTRTAPSGPQLPPPLKMHADSDDIEPSLRTPTAAAPELPNATPRLHARPQCVDPPSPFAGAVPHARSSASMATLSRSNARLTQRASLIIQDDGVAQTPAESPPPDADGSDPALHAHAPPQPDALGRHLSAALPSYLKIPTIIPSSYASPSASPPEAQAPIAADAFPPRVVYSDQKEAAFLAASLKEVQAHDVPKPFLAPVSLTWHGRGRRVFVTGTFAHAWGSKIPLRQTREGGPFVRTLYLPPGTHRLKFIVDNRWRVSNELNTASDGDGNMVNYVEVPSVSTAAPVPDAPDAPDASWAEALADLHVQPRGSDWEEMLGDDPAAAAAADGTWTDVVPAGVVLAQETEEALHEHEMDRDAPALLPTPPMMPPQLEKVILNSSPANIAGSMCVPSTVVDDTSVLPAPNHAVLNHLAASAIKNGVLAVGSVQRYKRKYVTTLLYRPVQP